MHGKGERKSNTEKQAQERRKEKWERVKGSRAGDKLWAGAVSYMTYGGTGTVCCINPTVYGARQPPPGSPWHPSSPLSLLGWSVIWGAFSFPGSHTALSFSSVLRTLSKPFSFLAQSQENPAVFQQLPSCWFSLLLSKYG